MTQTKEVDRLITAHYEAAFEMDWERFRQHSLQAVCDWAGASAAAWLLRARDDLEGEFAQWPADAGFSAADITALHFVHGQRDQRFSSGGGTAVALRLAHRGTALQSVIVLRLTDDIDLTPLRRVLGHLVQAATLALRQFVQRDEWLMEMGRSSRGSAALVDRRGTIYVASSRFRELIGIAAGSSEFATLPFPLPEDGMDEHGHFTIGSLHLRARPQGRLLLINARRPHPLDELSAREQEIARSLAQGKTFKSVAREYGIAISTVANHASRIYRKLGLYRREELVELLRKASEGRPF